MVTDADLPLLSSILIGPTKKRRTKARSRISVNLLQQTKSHAIELLQVNKPWSCRLSPLKKTPRAILFYRSFDVQSFLQPLLQILNQNDAKTKISRMG